MYGRFVDFWILLFDRVERWHQCDAPEAGAECAPLNATIFSCDHCEALVVVETKDERGCITIFRLDIMVQGFEVLDVLEFVESVVSGHSIESIRAILRENHVRRVLLQM